MEAFDYITALRKLMTQEQISHETGISQSTISKIENKGVADVMSKNYRALEALYNEKFLPIKMKKGK